MAGLKKKIEKIARDIATETVDAQMQKLTTQLQEQQMSNVGKVVEAKSPNTFIVEDPKGNRHEVTHISNRAVGKDSHVIVSGWSSGTKFSR